jgi:hypothetical protein
MARGCASFRRLCSRVGLGRHPTCVTERQGRWRGARFGRSVGSAADVAVDAGSSTGDGFATSVRRWKPCRAPTNGVGRAGFRLHTRGFRAPRPVPRSASSCQAMPPCGPGDCTLHCTLAAGSRLADSQLPRPRQLTRRRRWWAVQDSNLRLRPCDRDWLPRPEARKRARYRALSGC